MHAASGGNRSWGIEVCVRRAEAGRRTPEFAEFPTTRPLKPSGSCRIFSRPRAPCRRLGSLPLGPSIRIRNRPPIGYITSTPKVSGRISISPAQSAGRWGTPIAFDTDVNAAALAESRWGAGCGIGSFIYVTVGAGMGGGAIEDGRLLHGTPASRDGTYSHPARSRCAIRFPAICPYHGDCLEGLAAGPAIEARWGQPGALLPGWSPGLGSGGGVLGTWHRELDVYALARAHHSWAAGIMRREELFAKVRVRVAELLNGYWRLPKSCLPSWDAGGRTGGHCASGLWPLTVSQPARRHSDFAS